MLGLPLSLSPAFYHCSPSASGTAMGKHLLGQRLCASLKPLFAAPPQPVVQTTFQSRHTWEKGPYLLLLLLLFPPFRDNIKLEQSDGLEWSVFFF